MISAQAIFAVLRINLQRRPLWPIDMAQGSLDVPRRSVLAMIESGALPWAWNISAGRSHKDFRILAHCVVEQQSGPVAGVGKTRDLELPEVLNLLLPQIRPTLRGVDLQRLFACSADAVRDLHRAGELVMVAERRPAQGTNSSPRFTRESIAHFLERRRVT
jgi:hypothetical protein